MPRFDYQIHNVIKKNLQLPPKLRCAACRKFKTTDQSFSNRKLDNFKNSWATGRINPDNMNDGNWITCVDCSAGPRMEMTCSECKMIKGLNGFAKAQRRTPDTPVCIECMIDIENVAPIADKDMDNTDSKYPEPEYDDDEYDDDDDLSDGVTNAFSVGASTLGGGVPLSAASSTHALNEQRLKSLDLQQQNNSSEADQKQVIANWQNFGKSSASTGRSSFTQHPTVEQPLMAYGPSSHVGDDDDKQSFVGESSVAASTQYESDLSFVTTKASMTAREKRNRNSKFAKVGARCGPKNKKDFQYVGGMRKQDDSSSDSDDSDNEFKTI